MASLNKIQIIGFLGKDPEMRFLPNGKPITTFSVATTSSYKKGEEGVKDTQWFNIITFGKVAERCNQSLNKGTQVCVEGSVKLNEWEDKDGVKHSKLKILANSVLPLGKIEKAKETQDNEVEPEDIPF